MTQVFEELFLAQARLVTSVDDANDAVFVEHPNLGKHLYPIRGSRVRDLIMLAYRSLTEEFPSQKKVNEILYSLEAHGRFSGEQIPVCRRIAYLDQGIFVDLFNKQDEVVKITADGWSVQVPEKAIFVAYDNTGELPRPMPNGDFSKLFNYLNTGNAEEQYRTLLTGFCLACLIPPQFQEKPTYPLLVIQGEAGSGKTTMTNLLKQLIDPEKTGLSDLPKTSDDLYILASKTHLPAFDNLSRIKGVTSDDLARLVCGTSTKKRKLYTDSDLALIRAHTPLIINGIGDIADRQDLLDRSIIINLSRIAGASNTFSKQLGEQFHKDLPEIIGGLYDGVAAALKNFDTAEPATTSRLDVINKWGTAASSRLPELQNFAQALRTNQEEAILGNYADDPLTYAIRKLLELQQEWTGTPTDLLIKLKQVAEEVTGSGSWPKDARALSQFIKQRLAGLALLGVQVEYSRTSSTRVISLSRNSNFIASQYEVGTVHKATTPQLVNL